MRTQFLIADTYVKNLHNLKFRIVSINYKRLPTLLLLEHILSISIASSLSFLATHSNAFHSSPYPSFIISPSNFGMPISIPITFASVTHRPFIGGFPASSYQVYLPSALNLNAGRVSPKNILMPNSNLS